MKILLSVLFILFLYGCATTFYTSSKYFDCSQNDKFKLNTDRQKLIYEILKRAVIVEKDLPDYQLIKDKKKIYICHTYFSKFFGATKDNTEEFQFKNYEIPSEILGVRFCLKSKKELQRIADETTDFVYLTIGNIEITENIAKIGIASSWQSKSNSKIVYLSGGGYILQYKKINSKWKYDKTLHHWIS